jgi:hypothetical protein
VVSAEELIAHTSGGWEIYFNPSDSLDAQLNALEKVLEDQIKGSYLNLEYIDLRIEGRVYYKEKE